MNTQFKSYVFVIICLLLLLSGCQDNSGSTTSALVPPASGSGSIAHVDQPGGEGAFAYTHDLGATPQDMFLIFTNIGFGNSSGAVQVGSSQLVHSAPAPRQMPASASILYQETDLTAYAIDHGIGLRGRPEISEYNANPPIVGSTKDGPRHSIAFAPSLSVTEGDTHNFWAYREGLPHDYQVSATARRVIDVAGDIVLTVWVENDSWGLGCSKQHCLTQTMIDAVAEKFLKANSDNDIYDWVTNIYGAPWGTHGYTNLIPESAKGQIDIFFLDIDQDNSDTGGVLGYFWSRDNLLASGDPKSNERLIFYMDAVLTATPDIPLSWTINDEWPKEMVSTLAHEFQHMIHYYQKSVKNQLLVGTETWINEMASMVTEDLIADKILADGPRGIAYADYSAGSATNGSGRLPLYNLYNYFGVSDWYVGNAVLISYALNYSLGAYLARNYGGAELFRRIVQNNRTDYTAIEQALSDSGYTITFADILQRWGVAALLSNTTDSASGYRYNSGTSFDSTLGTATYRLGSINLYSYTYRPAVFSLSNYPMPFHYKTSNTYFLVGTGLTGTIDLDIDMPSNMRLSVVTKPSS